MFLESSVLLFRKALMENNKHILLLYHTTQKVPHTTQTWETVLMEVVLVTVTNYNFLRSLLTQISVLSTSYLFKPARYLV